MKMVLASIRYFVSLSHHIIKLRILTMTLIGTACSCLGVSPSGPGAIDKSSLAAFISSGMIRSQRPSSVCLLVQGGMDITTGSVITSCQWNFILSLEGCGVSPIPLRILSTHRALDLLQVLCPSAYHHFLRLTSNTFYYLLKF